MQQSEHNHFFIVEWDSDNQIIFSPILSADPWDPCLEKCSLVPSLPARKNQNNSISFHIYLTFGEEHSVLAEDMWDETEVNISVFKLLVLVT